MFTIDTAMMSSYNGGAVPTYATLLTALSAQTAISISGGDASASNQVAGNTKIDSLDLLLKTIKDRALLKSTLDSLLYKQNQVMGLRGHYPAIITTATTYIPLGRIVEVLEAAVIASLSYTDQTDSLTTITANAGQRFYGRFKHIKLTSGKVIVYK